MAIAGRYHLLEFPSPIVGGMGVVHAAIDRRTNLPVAVKINSHTTPRAERRFRKEASALARLDHPDIVRYLDHGVTETGQLYLVMEWLVGCTLSRYIRKHRKHPMSEQSVIQMTRRLCDALQSAHNLNVIHRDLSPANIYLVQENIERIKVIDFGLALTDDPLAPPTRPGTLLGTLGYFSPEQAESPSTVDARADIYSLGAVMYTCLTGRPPFIGTLREVLLKLVLEPPPAVRDQRSDVSQALSDIVGKMLSRDVRERPRSTAALAIELANLDERPPTVSDKVPEAISLKEQQYFSLLLLDPTAFDPQQGIPTEFGNKFQGRFYSLNDGTKVGVFAPDIPATEMATNAVMCALSLHTQYPHASKVVVTGRGVSSERIVVGEVIERASRMLFSYDRTLDLEGGPGAISPDVFIDPLTAELVANRFHLVDIPQGGCIVRKAIPHSNATIALNLMRAEFVGRERELTTIQQLFQECVLESSPRIGVVTAPQGAGKSRLVYELLRRLYASNTDATVWTAFGDPRRKGASLGLLATLVEQAVGIAPLDPVASKRNGIHQHVHQRINGPEADRVACFLGEIAGAPCPSAQEPQIDAARQDGRLMRDQKQHAWEELLCAEAERHPVLCIIDDMQWCDPPTMNFLARALRNLRNSPIMLLCLAQPEWQESLPDALPTRHIELALPPLQPEECRRVAVQRFIGPVMPDRALERLIERSGGNPLFLELLIRHITDSTDEELPETVLAMVSARLNALPVHEKRILRAASVFGPRFWVQGLQALLGEPANQIEQLLERLCDHELIDKGRRSRFVDQREYRFRHELIREAAYSALPVEESIMAHERAGNWLHDKGERDAVTMANHYWRGQRHRKALPWLYSAAAQALETDDVAAVSRYAERAITCGADGAQLGSMRLLQAEALNWRDTHDKAYEQARAAMNHLPRGLGQWGHAAHQAAWAAALMGSSEKLDAVADELSQEVPEVPDEIYLRAMAHCTTHLALLRRSQRAQSLQRVVEDKIASSDTSDLLRATIAHMKSIVAYMHGHLDEATSLSLQASEYFEAAGNLRNACLDLGNHGLFLSHLGAYERSIPILQRCIEQATRIGLQSVQHDHEASLALALAKAGRLDDARKVSDAVTVKHDQPDWQAIIYVNRAQIALLGNDTTRALQDTENALSSLRPESAADIKARVMAVRAHVLLTLGRAQDALNDASQGLKELQHVDMTEFNDTLLRLVYAEALYENAEHEQARAAIAQAKECMYERANRIEDETWREHFLSKVDENRRTLELAARWQIEDAK